MASLNPFVSPNTGNKPWVERIRKTLHTQLEVTKDTPPVSVFEVPKFLKEENPEAYVPQRVALGPYHHFQPELYKKTEQNKLITVKRLLKYHQIYDCQQEIVEKVKAMVPIIRTSYDLYLDADEDTLAWLFVIDGMFLLDQIDAFSNHRFDIETNDFFMLENQIPLIVLMEIQKALCGDNPQDQKEYLESKFRHICKSYSPFHLTKENIDISCVSHLLDYMYRSIIDNETTSSIKVDFRKRESNPCEEGVNLELLEAVLRCAELIPGAEPFLLIIDFVKSYFFGIDKGKEVEEITVPSVSELNKIAGVKFRLSPKIEGIRNIHFDQGKERFCYLPYITLNNDSEVILRNLVAYEKLIAGNSCRPGYGLEVTEYVDFMCGIIDNVKDVKLLREEKIIQGDLDDEEIVKLFNGIGKSYVNMCVETELRKTVIQLNNVYESTPRIWVPRLVVKQFMGSAKIIAYLVIFSSVLFIIREVYLKIYGSNPPHVKLVRFVRTKLSHLFSLFIDRKGPDAFV